ncbi:hypothetical protein D030_1824B, partial [Vibrio parahaemolyticus AQ3810]
HPCPTTLPAVYIGASSMITKLLSRLDSAAMYSSLS